MTTRRIAAAASLLAALALGACTSASGEPTTSTSTTTQASATEPSTVPSTTTTAGTTVPVLEPPTVKDLGDVALEQLPTVDGYQRTSGTDSDVALAKTADAWVPETLTPGRAGAVYQDDEGNHVVVYSVIPPTGLRGYPWLASVLAVYADALAAVPDDSTAVLEVEAETGGVFSIWATGDGALIAMSEDPARATTFLEAAQSSDIPNEVWSPGDCLYLPQHEPDFYGNRPWAPFTLDLVVPCTGPHNAEVLLSEYVGTDLGEFDGEAIAAERSYVCDKAYTDVFGRPQGEYRPTMVTYMPDIDEWGRGDRYLACLVSVDGIGGSELLFTDHMTALPDLDLQLEVGDCTIESGKDPISCAAAHTYQYLGSVEYSGDDYSVISDELDVACEALGVEFVDGTGTDAEVILSGFDPGAYQFELGYRRVNCYAIAILDFVSVRVTGSFLDRWSVVDENAASA
jgi:hypothetical protein